MKSVVFAMAALAAFPAFADKKLAEKKNCLSCHSVDQKIVGPAFKEVAAKYASQGDASTMLASKIQKGGGGVWGQIPMPPNNVTAEEATQLATWVLSLK